MSAGPTDPSRWAVVSPWLDRLLDAADDAALQTRLLAEAAAQDPALPDELRGWLSQLDQPAHQAFMQAPAVASGQGPAATARPPLADSTGQRVGAYTVQRLLGQGGMGSVWLAQRADGRYDSQVAIKFLHGGVLGRAGAQRFAREGQILARLDHPHIARLLDAGLTDGPSAGLAAADTQPYLVLEYVHGVPIDEYVKAQALDPRATVRLFMDVLAAVAHAHERLTLHRDLKPSNILVTPQGQVKLLDFGIAKLVSDTADTSGSDEGAAPPLTLLTQKADRAYTLRYAAPEQVQGREATTATDVYALGVLLYVLLTGGLHPTAAPDAADPLAQLNALVHTVPPLASIALGRQGGAPAPKRVRALQGDLDTIIGRALKKVPAERYRNAAELADDLQRYLNHEPIAARPDGRAYRLAKFLQRHRWGVAAVASVMLALGTGTALALFSAREAQAQRELATQRSEQAEGLVSFMLNDLRNKLEPVGRLDVLDAVGMQVLDHYEKQDAARLDTAALGQRGQALTLVGRMAEKRGQFAEAERSHAQAVASLAELARREPNNPQRLVAYSEALNQLGEVRQQRGDLVSAEAAWREALALNTKAHALQPDPALLAEVVGAQMNLAVFLVQAQRPAEALTLLEAAEPAAVSIAQNKPADWHIVGILLSEKSEAQHLLGRIPESITTLESNLQALAKVPDVETNRRVQLSRARTLTRMAGSQLTIGQLDAAVRNYSEAVRTDIDLTKHDPTNVDYAATLVRHRLFLIEALAWAGQLPQARSQLMEAQNELQRLQDRADAPLSWRMLLPGLQLLRQVLLNPRDAPLPAAMQAYVDAFSGPRAAQLTYTSEHHRMLARVTLQLGNVQALRGQTAQAQRNWRSALDLLEGPAEGRKSKGSGLLALAEVHWRLGHHDQAQALVAQLEKSDFRLHPECVAIVREMQRQPLTAAIR